MRANSTRGSNDAATRALLSFQALGYSMLLTACLAVNSVIGNGGFLFGSAAVALLGNGVSLVMRRNGKTSRLVEVAILGVCLVLYMRLLAMPYEITALRPGSIDAPQIRFAELLIWMECLRSFTLTSNEAVLFTGVSSIASLGLVATDNMDFGMMIYFALYVLCAVATLTHYSAQSARLLAAWKGVPRFTALTQFRLPLIVTILAVGAGWLLSGPLRVGSVFVLGRAIPTLAAQGIVRLPSFGPSSSSVPVMSGPAYLGNTELLMVRADRACYWRANAYTRYSGSVWDNSQSWRMNLREQMEPPKSSKHLFRQIVTFRRGFKTSELVAAAEPRYVKIQRPNDFVGLFADEYNCWSAGRREQFKYVVHSTLPVDNPARLASAGAEYPREIERIYLQTPSLTKSNPVRALALRVTRDCANPYEKAIAIESYLSREYAYDLNPPRPPRGKDVVEYFLFDSRRGYCTAFASAMVIMLREIGIPARLATGFAPGKFDPSRKVYRVLEKDRHAWAEVYFPKCGWVPFDASGADARRQSFGTLVGIEIRRTIGQILGSRPWLPVGIALLFSLVCLARPDLAARKLSFGRRLPADPGRRKLLKYYVTMCRIASITGLRRRSDQTPSEFASMLLHSPRLPQGADDLVQRITRDFESVKYGGQTPDRAMLVETELRLRELRSRFSRRRCV